MKLAALAVIATLSGMAAPMGMANATPLAPDINLQPAPSIVQVRAAAARVGVRPGAVAYPTPVGGGPALPVGVRANGAGGGRPHGTAWNNNNVSLTLA